jgi:octaprenyl-diphosphate synthase
MKTLIFLELLYNMTNSGKDKGSVGQLTKLLQENLKKVDQEIIYRLDKSIPLINDIGIHLINASGKRLRPLLTLAMAAQLNDYSKNPVILAAAVEFIHTATLLHDDVVDESNLRRGKKTANVIWGNEFSVLAGDFLFAQSFELMVETGSIQALSSLASASCKITQGEFQQMQIANKPDTTKEQYLDVIGKKTAELFGASCESGIIVANGSFVEQKAAYNYGFNLGLAFQIIDDLMDFNAQSKEMGKNLGDDFKLGKTTLPIILAWEKSNASEKQFWNKTLKELKQDTNDFEKALTIFNKYNIFEDCKIKAQEFISKSKISLDQLPNTEFKEHLIGLADESIQRSK